MKLQEIANELIMLNPKMLISGSVGLRMQGIKIEREPSDLDMYLPYGEELKTPTGMNPTDELVRYGVGAGGRMAFEYNGTKVDIFIDDCPCELKSHKIFKCLLPEDIIHFKLIYAFGNHETAMKH